MAISESAHALPNGWRRSGKTKRPRPAASYRGARRNAARGEVWRGIKSTGAVYHGPVRENVRRTESALHRSLFGGLKASDRDRMVKANAKRARRAERNKRWAEAGGFR